LKWQSAELASTWWVRASAQGFAEAQYNLAVCMLHGKGVPKDEAGAVKMLKGAAQQDHAEAMCMLASLLSDGLAGVKPNKVDALALYTSAAKLGSEEAQYKKLVMEDLVARESDLEVLQTKIGKINEGFIQLQLERAANEEVSHAYKGAGFFLSNMKSETPARARIEQAKRAESEIKKLRRAALDKEHESMSFAEQIDVGKQEVKTLYQKIVSLEDASEGVMGKMETLMNQAKALEASEVKLKNQVKDLLSENTELRAVADWAKNQRVEALKQALSSVVKTTIAEQNEREKMLRTELQNMRKQLAVATAAAGGKASVVVSDEADDSSAFLKRVRRDMLMQEVLLKEILTGMRHEDDYSDQVEFLKEAVGRADDGERLLKGACEEILDHVDTSAGEMTDDETQSLRKTLERIMKSIEEKKRPEGARPNTAMGQVMSEIDEIKIVIARISENLLETHASYATPKDKLKEIEKLGRGLSEINLKFKNHTEEVQKRVEEGKVELWVLDHHDEMHGAIKQLREALDQGVNLTPEARQEIMQIKLANQTPAASRVGTAGSRSLGRREGGSSPFRPTSANRGTMTDSHRNGTSNDRGSRSPQGGKYGRDTANSPVNFPYGEETGEAIKVEGSVTLAVIQESIKKLAEKAGGASVQHFDDAMTSVNIKLEKVLAATRGETVSRGSTRPGTPVHGWVVGEDGQRVFKKGSDAGSQANDSNFPGASYSPGKSRGKEKRDGSMGPKFEAMSSQVKELMAAQEASVQDQVGRVRAELEVLVAECKGKIEVLESEKKALESEKLALEAEKRLANNEAKRATMDLTAAKNQVEQQIAFEKAMVHLAFNPPPPCPKPCPVNN